MYAMVWYLISNHQNIASKVISEAFWFSSLISGLSDNKTRNNNHTQIWKQNLYGYIFA